MATHFIEKVEPQSFKAMIDRHACVLYEEAELRQLCRIAIIKVSSQLS